LIALGDATDQPYAIDINPRHPRWPWSAWAVRHENLSGALAGGNLVPRRELVDRLGPFDEALVPGSAVGSGDDTGYVFRAFLAGIELEHVPDMVGSHHHGRKTARDGRAMLRRHMIGGGALLVKHGRAYSLLRRQAWWDVKTAVKEALTGANLFHPRVDLSYRAKVLCDLRGTLRYVVWGMRRRGVGPRDTRG
jgi:GT2 family glycosyltransferase